MYYFKVYYCIKSLLKIHVCITMDLVKNRNYYSCSYYHHGRGGASGVYAILNWGPWNTGVPKEFFQWDPNMKNNLYGGQGTLCHCYLVKLFCIDIFWPVQWNQNVTHIMVHKKKIFYRKKKNFAFYNITKM